MKTMGIIAEFNPFHLGHRHLMMEGKKLTGSSHMVVVMSGNSVQRGDFALVDKFARAEEAIRNGADLVLEMPFCYCSQSAAYFAQGGIEILEQLGFVDWLVFGSESNNVAMQQKVASLIHQEEGDLQAGIYEKMKEGRSFPRARGEALMELYGAELGEEWVMNLPNDILAVEYRAALQRLSSKIEPLSVQRIGAMYNDSVLGQNFPSATAIRKYFLEKRQVVTEESHLNLSREMMDYLLLKQQQLSLGSLEHYFDLLQGIVLRDREKLADIFEVKEGIHHRLLRAMPNCQSVAELIHRLKSKRYTYTMLHRMLMNVLVGLLKEDMEKVKRSTEFPYSRILALNDKGRALIKKSEVQLINKPADFTPKSELHQILWHYDEIVNDLFYTKYQYDYMGKRVYSQKMTSPIYKR